VTRDRAERAAALGCSALALIAVLVAGIGAAMASSSVEREIWPIRASGWAALIALGLALCATPADRLLARVLPGRVDRTLLRALRRALGMTAAWLAAGHALLSLSTYLDGALPSLLTTPWLRSGLVALCILVALLVTSFPALVRALRIRLWKALHRLAHVAALLVLHHLLLSPFAPRIWVLSIFAFLFLFGMLRMLPRPPAPATGGSRDR